MNERFYFKPQGPIEQKHTHTLPQHQTIKQ